MCKGSFNEPKIETPITPPLLTLIVACSIIAVWVIPQPASSTDPPQTIESDDPLIFQTGTWTSVNTSNASGGSYLYASSSADTLTLDFYGTSIDVIYVEAPTFGSFTVEIDNTAVRTVTATHTQTEFGAISSYTDLADAPHTARIMGIQGTIAIDAFISALPPLALPTLTPSPTPDGWTPPSGGVPESAIIYDPIELPTSGCPPESQTEAFNLIATDTLTEVANISGLESAIDAANNGTVITPHTICLKDGGQDDYIFTHTLIINSDINIYSSGDADKTVKGADLFDGPLLDIKVGRKVELSHINLRDANHSSFGGGIINAGTLHIFDSYVNSHQTTYGGSGIMNFGTLYITRSTVSSNYSFSNTSANGIGAAVFNEGDFVAYCSQFHNNYGRYRGALTNAFFNADATMTIHQSSFSGNTGRETLLQYPNDINNSSVEVIDVTDNYWSGGGSVTPYTVNKDNPLTYDPTVPTSLGFNPDCGSQPRPLLQSKDPPFCIVKTNADIKAYISPVSARTEYIEYITLGSNTTGSSASAPFPDSPELPYLEITFTTDTQLYINGRYRYANDTLENPTGDYVVRVAQFNSDPSDLDKYDPDDEWMLFLDGEEEYFVWIYDGQDEPDSRVTVIEQDVNNDPIDNCNNLESIEFSEQELRLIDTRHYYIEELRSYGIEPQDYGRAFPNVIGYPLVPRKWEDTELEVVLQAAIDTSTAFQNIGNFSTSDPKAIFHIIMDNFTVVRVENNHSSASCSTPAVNDNACTDNNMSLIGFWGDIATNRTPIGFTKELVVHEFGHRFDNEVEAVTGTSFRSRVSDAVIRSDATPQNQRGALVMGVFVIENERQWSRGPRGWGTGWVVDAGGERQISRLQQSDFDTFDETAADMFLNWVYRYVDGTGFLNRSWNPLEENGEGVPCSQIEEGCPDGTNPGDARFNWMEEQFEEIFGEGSTW